MENKEERKALRTHSRKYLASLVNLLTASERFDQLPEKWQDDLWSLVDPKLKKLVRLRNNSLYLRFNMKKRLTTPDKAIPRSTAALLVFMAGFAASELKDYVSLDPNWADSVYKASEAFGKQYLNR